MTRRFNAKIIGTGMAVPDRILTNFDLEKMVDTSDEWIVSRSGIRERRIADQSVAASDLALEASLKALDEAKLKSEDLELIVVGTVTPDFTLPSTACILQHRLNNKKAAVMDVVAACTGFIYGLSVARAFIVSGQFNNALVIGVEILSKFTNWDDRNTCVLFGDGSGAAVVQASDEDGGIISTYLCGDGSLASLLHAPIGGTRTRLTKENFDLKQHNIIMAGSEVFKSAVRAMEDSASKVIQQAGLKPGDIDLLIPHQANIRIIEATAKRLKIPMDKVYVNIDRYGNTSSASVPIALDEARKKGIIKQGYKVVLVAFGGGFTWGAALIKW